FHAIGAHHMADRPFCCDMNRVRISLLDSLRNLAAPRQSQTQIWIRRQGKGKKSLRREKIDRDAQASCAAGQRSQSPHHAIDLGMPSISCDKHSHRPAHTLSKLFRNSCRKIESEENHYVSPQHARGAEIKDQNEVLLLVQDFR